MDEKAAFALFNLTETASLKDAKNAYRTLAKKYHPDVMRKEALTEIESEARMKAVNQAYRVIVAVLKHRESISKKPESFHCEKKPQFTSKSIENEESDGFIGKLKELLKKFFFDKPSQASAIKKNSFSTFKNESQEVNGTFSNILRSVFISQPENKKQKIAIPIKTRSMTGFKKKIGLPQLTKSRYFYKNRKMGVDINSCIEPVSRINPVNRV